MSLISFFSKNNAKDTFDGIRIPKPINKQLNIGMTNPTPLQKVPKIIIIIQLVLQRKILPKRLPHIKDFGVFAFVLFEGRAVYYLELLELGDRTQAHVLVAEKVVYGVVL